MRSAISSTSFSLWVMKMIDLPALGQAADDLEQLLRLLRRQHGGRLVEDEDVRLAVERLEDLDALLLADGDVLDPRAAGRRRARSARRSRGRAAPPRSMSSRTPDARRLLGEHDVLGDGHHRDEHEVLVHHPDARLDRVVRRAEPHRLALDRDLALVRVVEPVEDVHQRRLAGAVLAEERVHLALDRGRSSTSSFATIPGKRFVMSRISSTGAVGHPGDHMVSPGVTTRVARHDLLGVRDGQSGGAVVEAVASAAPMRRETPGTAKAKATACSWQSFATRTVRIAKHRPWNATGGPEGPPVTVRIRLVLALDGARRLDLAARDVLRPLAEESDQRGALRRLRADLAEADAAVLDVEEAVDAALRTCRALTSWIVCEDADVDLLRGAREDVRARGTPGRCRRRCPTCLLLRSAESAPRPQPPATWKTTSASWPIWLSAISLHLSWATKSCE